MARVNETTFKPIHIRTARALLDMSARQFAEYAGAPITFGKVRNFEQSG